MQSILDRVFPALADSFPLPAILILALTLLPFLRSRHLAAPPDPLPLELEGIVLVCDASLDRVVRLYDADGSGAIDDDTGEIGIFYDDSSPGPDLSTPSHLAPAPQGSVLLLDGGSLDQVLLLQDQNLDGDANDDAEITVFYDNSMGGPSLYTPNTLLPSFDGGLYVSDDGSRARRIVRLEDVDGNGDALGAGESRVVYDSTAQSSPLLEDVESLAEYGDGVLLAGDATLQAIFKLEDIDGDGTFLGLDEVRPFFSGDVDFPVGDVEVIRIVNGVVFTCDRQSGRILRMEDTNADGDAEDSGEVSVFLDDTAAGVVSDVTDLVPLPDGGFLVIDNADDTLHVVADLNGDGDALDDSEVLRWLLDGGKALALPSGLLHLSAAIPPPPVDVPFLRGDSTGDGKLDVSDPIATLNFLFLGETTPGCPDAMDVDDNGALNISDSIWALNFLFLGGPSPAPPFPEPGVDPTQDSLDC